MYSEHKKFDVVGALYYVGFFFGILLILLGTGIL